MTTPAGKLGARRLYCSRSLAASQWCIRLRERPTVRGRSAERALLLAGDREQAVREHAVRDQASGRVEFVAVDLKRWRALRAGVGLQRLTPFIRLEAGRSYPRVGAARNARLHEDDGRQAGSRKRDAFVDLRVAFGRQWYLRGAHDRGRHTLAGERRDHRGHWTPRAVEGRPRARNEEPSHLEAELSGRVNLSRPAPQRPGGGAGLHPSDYCHVGIHGPADQPRA